MQQQQQRHILTWCLACFIPFMPPQPKLLLYIPFPLTPQTHIHMLLAPILLFCPWHHPATATYLPIVDEQRNIHSESNEQQAQKQKKQDGGPPPRSSAQGLAGAESRSMTMRLARACEPVHLGVEYEVSQYPSISSTLSSHQQCGGKEGQIRSQRLMY